MPKMSDVAAVLSGPAPEPSYDSDLETAMEDLIAAIKAGDAAGAAAAFKAGHTICSGSGEPL